MKTFFKKIAPAFLLITAIGFIGSSCGSDDTPCQTQTWYLDADSDGYGTDDYTIEACEAKTGYVAQNGDCDDSNPDINPGATEITLNGIDDNCNGIIDECLTDADCDGMVPYMCINGICQIAITYYADADVDGYGNPDDSIISGEEAPQGYVTDNTDCDDSNPDINPGATEISNNNLDDDCDGLIDEDPNCVPGNPCDDGNPNTVSDTWDENCNCIGN